MVKKSLIMESQPNNNNCPSSCKYKGVRKRKWGKYVSEIRLPNSRERIWLGSYDTAEKAARAFDAAQFCLRGKSANFNFPDNPPDIAGARSLTRDEIQAAAARFANMGGSVVQMDDSDQQTKEEESENQTAEESISYSPSISDGATVQIDSEVGGIEMSFHEQLRLSTTIGSGNFVSEFGYFNGFEDFTAGDFYNTSQPDNFDCGGDDTYDASVYQDSYLWNF